MNGRRAAGVQKALSQAEVHAQLSKPAAAPDPVGGEGEDQSGDDAGDEEASGETQAVRARSPGQHGRQSYGEKLKEHGQLRLCRRSSQSGQQEGSSSNPVPGLTGQVESESSGSNCARLAAGQGSAENGEGQHRDGQNGQIAQQRLRRRARAAQAGIDQRHSGDGQWSQKK